VLSLLLLLLSGGIIFREISLALSFNDNWAPHLQRLGKKCLGIRKKWNLVRGASNSYVIGSL
jgi:hypothetical protein